MAHPISERELEILERDRKENCGNKGYRYIRRTHVAGDVVSDRQRTKTDRKKKKARLKKETVQVLPQSKTLSRRQRPAITAKPATRANPSPASSKPVVQKHRRQASSTRPNTSAATPTQDKTAVDIKAVSVRDIYIKTRSDSYLCCITGSAKLPGNKLVLADHNNNKIKLVNLDTSSIIAELELSSGPWGIASIIGDTVVATVPRSEKIAFIKIGNQLRLDRELPVIGQCHAVIHNNGNLIVSYLFPSKIEFMSLDGSAIRRIADSESFKFPQYMALSENKRTLYVSDYYGDSVKILALDGIVDTTCETIELRGPRGIACIGKQDRLLVCGYASHDIHLLEPDLTKVGVVLHGIYKPYSLSYCRGTGRLYVGAVSESIKVYQLLI